MADGARIIIDPRQLESLRELNEVGSQDIVTELIDIFLEQSPATLESLREQIKQLNAPMVEKLAHKLKGSCANLGAEYLRSLCQEVEEKGRSRSFSELELLIRKIDEAFAEVCEILNRDWRQPAA